MFQRSGEVKALSVAARAMVDEIVLEALRAEPTALR